MRRAYPVAELRTLLRDQLGQNDVPVAPAGAGSAAASTTPELTRAFASVTVIPPVHAAPEPAAQPRCPDATPRWCCARPAAGPTKAGSSGAARSPTLPRYRQVRSVTLVPGEEVAYGSGPEDPQAELYLRSSQVGARRCCTSIGMAKPIASANTPILACRHLPTRA